MDSVKKLKVVLFALTGFGNQVLQGLIKDPRVEVGAVFTVKYDSPFPYYVEVQLLDYCRENNIPCYHDIKLSGEEGMRILRELSPDLILVATFKQILRENVINLPPLGVVNFHPSLLPLYRGPSPTNAVLLNGEKITGITIHYITEKVDEGNILLQRSIPIHDVYDDGILRQKLAGLSGNMVSEALDLFDGYRKPIGTPQNNDDASYAPKPSVMQGYLELAKDIATVRNTIRALNPLPGTSILVGEERVSVDRYEEISCNHPDGIFANEYAIDLIINSQAIRLFRVLD